MGGPAVGRHLRQFPEWRIEEKAVARHDASDVAQTHIESIPLAVGPKGLFVQQVGPGREKWNPAHFWFLYKLGKVIEGEVQNVFSVHLHRVEKIAHGRHDGDFYSVLRVAEANDRDTVIRRFLSLVVLGKGSRRQ